MLLEAPRKSGIWTTIYRIGQVAGSTTVMGKWNPHEWLPIMIKTSKAMGKVPRTLGSMVIDWIPVDTLASVKTEMILARHTTHSNDPCAVYHELSIDPVDSKGWVAELEKIQNPTEVDLTEKPALKLMDFFRGLVQMEEDATARVVLDVSRAAEASATMREVTPITEGLLLNWLRQ